MKIEVLATHGSPLKVTLKSIYGEDGRLGVGGAELALLTMCEAWAKAGHEVVLYNNPKNYSPQCFDQKPVNSYRPENLRDVLIIFRAPTQLIYGAVGHKVWWSTDQFTIGDYPLFAKQVDKIVCISPYHQKYFQDHYGISDTVSIDLPVRTWDYEPVIDKVKNRCIFTSVPDRGLATLQTMWARIKAQIPDISLVITSDYRLWGCEAPRNDKFRMSFLGMPDVIFLGAVPRRQLVQEQLKAEILTFPCSYEELYCYAVAEAEVAGAIPVTSGMGALPTTNMGLLVSENPNFETNFVNTVLDLLKNPAKKVELASKIRQQALERFSIDKILKIWDEKVFAR